MQRHAHALIFSSTPRPAAQHVTMVIELGQEVVQAQYSQLLSTAMSARENRGACLFLKPSSNSHLWFSSVFDFITYLITNVSSQPATAQPLSESQLHVSSSIRYTYFQGVCYSGELLKARGPLASEISLESPPELESLLTCSRKKKVSPGHALMYTQLWAHTWQCSFSSTLPLTITYM